MRKEMIMQKRKTACDTVSDALARAKKDGVGIFPSTERAVQVATDYALGKADQNDLCKAAGMANDIFMEIKASRHQFGSLAAWERSMDLARAAVDLCSPYSDIAIYSSNIAIDANKRNMNA